MVTHLYNFHQVASKLVRIYNIQQMMRPSKKRPKILSNGTENMILTLRMTQKVIQKREEGKTTAVQIIIKEAITKIT